MSIVELDWIHDAIFSLDRLQFATPLNKLNSSGTKYDSCSTSSSIEISFNFLKPNSNFSIIGAWREAKVVHGISRDSLNFKWNNFWTVRLINFNLSFYDYKLNDDYLEDVLLI